MLGWLPQSRTRLYLRMGFCSVVSINCHFVFGIFFVVVVVTSFLWGRPKQIDIDAEPPTTTPTARPTHRMCMMSISQRCGHSWNDGTQNRACVRFSWRPFSPRSNEKPKKKWMKWNKRIFMAYENVSVESTPWYHNTWKCGKTAPLPSIPKWMENWKTCSYNIKPIQYTQHTAHTHTGSIWMP